jgi:hypothetical protein
MNILEFDLKQRAFDGKWESLGKIMDEDNAYIYVSESGQRVTHIPTKWVTLNVYDYILEPL